MSSISLPSHGVRMPQVIPHVQWATAEDWTRHRALVTRLYHDQRYSLKDVMKTMQEQYGFKATVKMYKQRIDQWNIGKRNKTREIRPTLYMNHKPVARGTTSKARSEACNAELYFASLPSSLPASMSDQEQSIIPERVLIMLGDYYGSSFKSNSRSYKEHGPVYFVTNTHLIALIQLNFLHDKCIRACQLFENGFPTEAGKSLMAGTAKIKDIVLADIPGSLALVFTLILQMRKRNHEQIAVCVLKFFSSMAEIFLNFNHPFNLICRWLARLSRDDQTFEDCIKRSMGAMGSIKQSTLKSLHMDTMTARSSFVQSVASDDGSGSHELMMRNLLENRICIGLNSSDARILHACLALPRNCGAEKDFWQANETVKALIDQIQIDDHQLGTK